MKSIRINLNDDINDKIDTYKMSLSASKADICTALITSGINSMTKREFELFILDHCSPEMTRDELIKQCLDDEYISPNKTLDIPPNTHEPYILDCDSISIAHDETIIAQDDITSDTLITDEEFVRDHMYDACTHNDLCTYTNIDTNDIVINTDDYTHVAINSLE